MSIETYYNKIDGKCHLIDLSANFIKIIFLRGLTPENWKKAIMISIELPLNELVEKLTRFQNTPPNTRCPNCLQTLK